MQKPYKNGSFIKRYTVTLCNVDKKFFADNFPLLWDVNHWNGKLNLRIELVLFVNKSFRPFPHNESERFQVSSSSYLCQMTKLSKHMDSKHLEYSVGAIWTSAIFKLITDNYII